MFNGVSSGTSDMLTEHSSLLRLSRQHSKMVNIKSDIAALQEALNRYYHREGCRELYICARPNAKFRRFGS